MFYNYFKIAWRNLAGNKTYSLINIGGLAVGMTVSMLIGLWIYDELSYNKYHENYRGIARVMQQQTLDGELNTGSNVPAPLFKELQNNFDADFGRVVITSWLQRHVLAYGGYNITTPGNFMSVGAAEMLSLKIVSGSAAGLKDPATILLSESVAKAFFKNSDPVDRMMKINKDRDVRVVGVYKDIPYNSEFHELGFIAPFDLFVSTTPWVKDAVENSEWENSSFQILVQLSENSDLKSVSEKIKDIKLRNASESELKFKPQILLHPMSRWHLYSEWSNGSNVGGRIEFVWLFGIIGVFVLLLACINFMNLSTARSQKRAREVGIRKALGSLRMQLAGQYFTESFLVVFFAFIISLLFAQLLLQNFNEIADKQMLIPWTDPVFLISGIVFTLLTGLIAGSYPAFYLSSFEPIQVLKKKGNSSGFFSINLRQVLVVGQFSFAVILIIATTVIYKQLQFIKNRPVGYQINELLEMPQDGLLTTKFEVLKERLIQSGAVTSVVQTSGSLSDSNSNFWGLEWPGSTEVERHLVFNQLQTTYDFVKTTGVKLIEGRDFSPHFASDTAAVLLSRLAIKRMNLINPIGQIVKYQGKNCTVIGVFEDFVWGSPYEANPPLVLAFSKQADGYVTLRMNSQHPANENIATIEKITKEINPAYPSEVRFVDQLYAVKLKSEKVLGTLSNLFGGLAIFISCLGLFGLATYSAEQRTKEIGVRKVLGASVFSLMQLLSFSFLKMVIIAIIIAVPIANYVMGNWLDSFELHTSISWLIILMAALSTIGIAIFTVSFQAYRAAKANPVNALKYE